MLLVTNFQVLIIYSNFTFSSSIRIAVESHKKLTTLCLNNSRKWMPYKNTPKTHCHGVSLEIWERWEGNVDEKDRIHKATISFQHRYVYLKHYASRQWWCCNPFSITQQWLKKVIFNSLVFHLTQLGFRKQLCYIKILW